MHLDKHRDFPAFVARMKATARKPATRRLRRAARCARARERRAACATATARAATMRAATMRAAAMRAAAMRAAAMRAAAMRAAAVCGAREGQRLPQAPGEIAPSLQRRRSTPERSGRRRRPR
ncbi:hypothetical protein [Sorangium sp. So ce394]|uniref:hypothetical protein n=1 Tax=Sorangium sp. So ce394 TaxID=3133310 RepID=UPI003F5C963A